MKCNINGFMRNISRPGTDEMQNELLDNLKELRDNPSKHQEFFDLYLFSDDKEYRAAKASEAPAEQTGDTQCTQSECDGCGNPLDEANHVVLCSDCYNMVAS